MTCYWIIMTYYWKIFHRDFAQILRLFISNYLKSRPIFAKYTWRSLFLINLKFFGCNSSNDELFHMNFLQFLLHFQNTFFKTTVHQSIITKRNWNIFFSIPLSKLLTFSAPAHLQVCSFIRLKLIKLSPDRLLPLGLRVFLLSEGVLSTLPLEFCNERQLFITFNKCNFSLSLSALQIAKTLAQCISIHFKFPYFSINQQSGTCSIWKSLNWPCNNVTSRSAMTWDNNCFNLPNVTTDIGSEASTSTGKHLKEEISVDRLPYLHKIPLVLS